MWQCEVNPNIGSQETRLLETVEPLWKTYGAPEGGWKLTSSHKLTTRLHQKIKHTLRSPLSWWKIAPLFSLPLSLYNLRYVLLVCNRLLKNHLHTWIPQKFVVQHAPTLCVLACAHENHDAAQKYFKNCPTHMYPKMLNVLCEIGAPTNHTLKHIIIDLASNQKSHATCYQFVTQCLKNNSNFTQIIASNMEISPFDWRCVLQMVGETWTDEQRDQKIDQFLNVVELQYQKYGCENFLYALNAEIRSLKYRHSHVPSGWKQILQISTPIWMDLREKYLSHSYDKNNARAFDILQCATHSVIIEAVLQFVQVGKSDDEMLNFLIKNNLFEAAEWFLETSGVVNCIAIDFDSNKYPCLHAASVKNKMLQQISLSSHIRNRKL